MLQNREFTCSLQNPVRISVDGTYDIEVESRISAVVNRAMFESRISAVVNRKTTIPSKYSYFFMVL